MDQAVDMQQIRWMDQSGHSVHTQEKTFPHASNAIMNMSVREQTNHNNTNKKEHKKGLCV